VTRAGPRSALEPRRRPALNDDCDYGNGEIGGNGIHDIDLARRGLLTWGMSCSILRLGRRTMTGEGANAPASHEGTRPMIRPMFWVACIVALIPPASPAAGPELVSVEKIWDRAPHNAFTDLIRWRGRWYCTFREAEAHVGGDGRIRVLGSSDGRRREPGALIAEEGIDLRDPKLSITPDDRLMIVAGGSVYRGTKTLMGHRPRVMFSRDGREWTAPRRVL
jgi:hypothetical protein